MAQGQVKWFNASKGYGFIQSPDIDGEVFVHFSTIVMEGYRKLNEADRVSFELEKTSKGFTAKNVMRLSPSLVTDCD